MEYRKEITCHYKFKKNNPQNGRKALSQKNKSKGPCCALGHYFWILVLHSSRGQFRTTTLRRRIVRR
jgi:hypothetical protein